MSKLLCHVKDMDAKLVNIIKDFSLLGVLSWPKEIMHKFLKNANKGNIKLPEVEYNKKNHDHKISEINQFLINLGNDNHPAISFLTKTAESYRDAYYMLNGVGTKDITEFSLKLYGSPKNIVTGYKHSSLKIAHQFLHIINEYKYTIPKEVNIFSAREFKQKIRPLINENIDQIVDPINIIIDKNISAKAAATSEGIKIRYGAKFSKNDIYQLFHHEVMIHALTKINGKKQPILKTLAYNSPRTTETQEGLATFSEYITMSMELMRLKRIVLRIIAISMAEDGADFFDLFKFFCEHGQDHEESYFSAMRIFRGGYPNGGIIFYKDSVYLQGLIKITAFLKSSVHKGLIPDIALLFCGKLNTDDISDFKVLLEEGYITEPVYIPDWLRHNNILVSHLAINDLLGKFNR